MSGSGPISVHAADARGFFRTQIAPLFWAGLCAFLVTSLVFPLKEGPEVAFWFAVACAVGLVASLAYAAIAYQGLVRKVTVYADRVEWKGRVAAWEDITDVWRTEIIVNGSLDTRQVVIEMRDGTEATFTYILSDWAGMAERIQVETAKVLGPPAFEAFEAGKPVKFGNVVVSPSGVVIGGRSVPWALAVRTTIEDGRYCVYQAGETWCSTSASLGETPNVLVLLRLLEMTPKPPYSSPDLRKRG